MMGIDDVSSLSLPPRQYDYEPSRSYVVQYVSEEELKQFCNPPFGYRIVGCTVLDRYILILEDMTDEAKAHVLRHEKGHVNGWNH